MIRIEGVYFGKIGRVSFPRHIDVSRAIYGYTMALIPTVPPKVCGIESLASIRTELEYKGITATPGIRIQSVYCGKIGRVSFPRHIDVSRAVHGYATATITIASPEVCGIDGMASIRAELEYKGIRVAPEIRIEGVYCGKIGRVSEPRHISVSRAVHGYITTMVITTPP